MALSTSCRNRRISCRIEQKNHLQDFRDLGPIHGGGKGGSCNILFADGSIKSFTDVTGDGYLNPGIRIDPAADFGTTGYRDSVNELPEAQIFSEYS